MPYRWPQARAECQRACTTVFDVVGASPAIMMMYCQCEKLTDSGVGQTVGLSDCHCQRRVSESPADTRPQAQGVNRATRESLRSPATGVYKPLRCGTEPASSKPAALTPVMCRPSTPGPAGSRHDLKRELWDPLLHQNGAGCLVPRQRPPVLFRWGVEGRAPGVVRRGLTHSGQCASGASKNANLPASRCP